MKTKDDFLVIPFEKLPGTKAWKTTSELVRKKANGICYTCKHKCDKLHAGHFREKRGSANIYFELDGLRGQCYRCNRILHGNYGAFILNLIDEIGRERVDILNRKAQKSKQWTKSELDKIAEERQKELDKLV
jgi:hypothetical protein